MKNCTGTIGGGFAICGERDDRGIAHFCSRECQLEGLVKLFREAMEAAVSLYDEGMVFQKLRSGERGLAPRERPVAEKVRLARVNFQAFEAQEEAEPTMDKLTAQRIVAGWCRCGHDPGHHQRRRAAVSDDVGDRLCDFPSCDCGLVDAETMAEARKVLGLR